MNDFPRLIEFAFPLKQASLDSVHEKNVRHGHISTLHIWPARRPLAACRAALIATLLPDPGAPEKRRELCEKIAGTVEKEIEKKKKPDGSIVEREKEVTKGGILHWGRETENAGTLEWFRQEIRNAYGGLPAPQPGKFYVYVIKCSDDSNYIGQTDNLQRRFDEHEKGDVEWTAPRRPLKLIHWEEYDSREEAVKREKDLKTGWGREWIKREYAAGRTRQAGRAPKVLDPFAGGGAIPLEAKRLGCEATAIDINPVAWFVLKCTLEYPQKLAGQTRPLPDFVLKDREFMTAFFKAQGLSKAQIQRRLEQLGHSHDQPLLRNLEIPDRSSGHSALRTPHSAIPEADLASETNPRWVAKPTVACLWARTVTCKNCRATIPLLKTRWLCQTNNRRVLLAMEPRPDKTGVQFGVQADVPAVGGNAAQKKANDKKIGAGTMTRSGAKCPCCPAIMTMEDIRIEGQAGRMGNLLTTVVMDGPDGKEFRMPTAEEHRAIKEATEELQPAFASVPFGVPTEPLPSKEALGFRVPLYGLNQWSKLFTTRQLVSLATLATQTREARAVMKSAYPPEWMEGLSGYLAAGLDRLLDFANCGAQWKIDVPTINHSFARFALPMTWDFAEGNPIGDMAGSYKLCFERICTGFDTFGKTPWKTPAPHLQRGSAIRFNAEGFDAIVTDPPYYDAIPYSDLMDFFYVWLRRMLHDTTPEFARAFSEPLAPKWSNDANDGELIDDSSRHNGDAARSKAVYEDGMARAFQACHRALKPAGRLVVVFANKQPDAWETLVSAMIRAGFVVDGSWPIQTEQPSRMRGIASAALASSVWMVCKKRDAAARAGWDKDVIEQMRTNIRTRLNEYWDAGIRGPDFVWAATGPALEAYSQHPAVLKANQQKERMSVSEFLTHVRRLVVDYIVGQVLSGGDRSAGSLPASAEQDESRGQAARAPESLDRLDDVTAYYLLHRHDFGFKNAPAGACILYAVSCGLSDSELVGTWDLLATTGGDTAHEEAEDEDETAEECGGTVKLKTWTQRRAKSLGYEAPAGKPVPLIDRIHRLMHLWRAGDVHKVDDTWTSTGCGGTNCSSACCNRSSSFPKPAGTSAPCWKA